MVVKVKEAKVEEAAEKLVAVEAFGLAAVAPESVAAAQTVAVAAGGTG